MKPLEHPDTFHLQAAIGWLGLGNWREANQELEHITPQLRTHPDVLSVRCQIYSDAHKWEYVTEIADALCRMLPNEAFGPIRLAQALRKLDRITEARDTLLPIADRFPAEWRIPFLMGCYYAQLGQLEQAQDWFGQAMVIDPHTVRQEAVETTDLTPLWYSMRGTLWKRAR